MLLRTGALNLLANALAPATRAAYTRALSRFKSFATLHKLSVDLPISVDTLSLFITYLFNQGLPASSISSILSAISYHHKIRNYIDPSKAFAIQQMLLTIRKERPTVDSRHPITENLLQMLIEALARLKLPLYEFLLFQAMFTLAFYFGLRIGEITKSPHNLNRSQIKVSKNQLSLTFISFKHSHADPFSHTYQAKSSPLCPVAAMNQYVKMRGDTQGPLFSLGNNPLTRHCFTSRLKLLLVAVGERKVNFNSHSFRIGAASMWASQGKSDIEIQRLGRWQSNAFRKYLRGTVVHS